MNNWKREWPTEPGIYWFYGWCFSKSSFKKIDEPTMRLAEVFEVSNGIMYVTDGHFLHKQEGAEGMWLKAELPTPPKEIKPR